MRNPGSVLEALREEMREQPGDPNRVERERIEKALAEQAEKRERLIDYAADGIILKEDCAKRLAPIERSIAELEERLTELAPEPDEQERPDEEQLSHLPASAPTVRQVLPVAAATMVACRAGRCCRSGGYGRRRPPAPEGPRRLCARWAAAAPCPRSRRNRDRPEAPWRSPPAPGP